MSSGALGLSRACIKTLVAVEADPNRSNQHEFNGVAALKAIFGLEKVEQAAIFSIRGENITSQANVTWYDARLQHATRSEHRLYFQTNPVMERAQAGDNVIIGFDMCTWPHRLDQLLLAHATTIVANGHDGVSPSPIELHSYACGTVRQAVVDEIRDSRF